MKKIALLASCLLLCSTIANAADRQLLGVFGDWTAYKMKENGASLCYMASTPQKSEGKYKKRGEIFLIVAHRPKEKAFNVLSLTAGYNYKKGSSAEIQIDKQPAIKLFTHEDTAWATDSKIDSQLYSLMKAGDKAVITGKSSLGNTTVDTFSLKGFTRAANAIDKACGKK